LNCTISTGCKRPKPVIEAATSHAYAVLLLDWYRFAKDRRIFVVRIFVAILALREVKETSMLPIAIVVVGEIPHELEYL
jgi:hypothetical protein